MPKPKMKDEKIQVNLTVAEKNQIEFLAKKSNKSQSQYLLDAGLANTIDTAKFDFYTTINSDLNYLKRISYVISKLELLIATEQYNDQEFVVKFIKPQWRKRQRFSKVSSQVLTLSPRLDDGAFKSLSVVLHFLAYVGVTSLDF